MRVESLIQQVQRLHREIIATNLWVHCSRHWNMRRNSSRGSLLSIRSSILLIISRSSILPFIHWGRQNAQCRIDLLISCQWWISWRIIPNLNIHSQDIFAVVTRGKAVGRTKDSPVANRIKPWRSSGIPSVRCSAISGACTPSFLICSTLIPLSSATSTASCSPVIDSYRTSGTVGIEGLAIAAV